MNVHPEYYLRATGRMGGEMMVDIMRDDEFLLF
jgi:hypothetical protein